MNRISVLIISFTMLVSVSFAQTRGAADIEAEKKVVVSTTEYKLTKISDWAEDNLALTEEQSAKFKELNTEVSAKVKEIKSSGKSVNEQHGMVKKLSTYRFEKLKEILDKKQYRELSSRTKSVQEKHKELVAMKKNEMKRQGLSNDEINDLLMKDEEGNLKDEIINIELGIF